MILNDRDDYLVAHTFNMLAVHNFSQAVNTHGKLQ